MGDLRDLPLVQMIRQLIVQNDRCRNPLLCATAPEKGRNPIKEKLTKIPFESPHHEKSVTIKIKSLSAYIKFGAAIIWNQKTWIKFGSAFTMGPAALIFEPGFIGFECGRVDIGSGIYKILLNELKWINCLTPKD